jgi:neutral trehalase
MTIFDEQLLSREFCIKAEKAITREQKIAFCESFLAKYKTTKNNNIFMQEYQATFPNAYTIRTQPEIITAQVMIPEHEIKLRNNQDIYLRELASHITTEIIKTKKMKIETILSHEQDARILRAKVGVIEV